MDNKDFFIKQLNSIISEYQSFANSCQFDDLSDKNDTVEMGTFITKSISAIERITGKTNTIKTRLLAILF